MRAPIRFGLMALGIVFFISVVQAADFNQVIANSEDWKDVYSIIRFSSLSDADANFLVSPRHGPTLLTGINKNRDVFIISSKKKQFVINYPSQVRAAGFKSVKEKNVDNANLDLIKDLKDVENFIIVGDSYGYNAIAVAPYAAKTKSWVFIAGKNNIDEIDSILSSRKANKIIVYGFVDREVRETLSKYSPEIINTGNRFDDNVAIVKKYLESSSVTQVLLTNGEFIESEIMMGVNPVLFTGKENVPEQIKNYLSGSNFQAAVLIGADLVGSATNIRRSTGISVIVKFARGARNPSTAVAAVENLDLFYLPSPTMILEINSAKYNKATSQLELTYRSKSNIPIYFKGTITPRGDSDTNTRFGDSEPVFIAPNDLKTVSYPDIKFNQDKMKINVFTLYGESELSLEKILDRDIDVENVDVVDQCKINIESALYSKPDQSFVIKIKNTGGVDCWTDLEMKDVIIDDSKKILGTKGSTKINAGKSKNIYLKQEMADSDLEKNPYVTIIAYYGEREDGLIKTIQGTFPLSIKNISLATIGLVVLGIVIGLTIILVLILLWKRRKEDEEDAYF